MSYSIRRQLKQQGQLFIIGCLGCLCCLLSACSESSEDEQEFVNWQERNEQYFASLQDSLNRDPSNWLKIKNYSLDESIEGVASEYIYAKVIERGEDGASPVFTDSVRVSYLGRLLPSPSYANGYEFDGTVYGSYNPKTNYTAKFSVSGLTDGFATAVQHMHRGDYWRIYVPWQLGYGKAGNTGIPGYSILVFDLTLIDFSPVGEPMSAYSARETSF